ncbi:hypothetical protein HPP92_017497 [Vanilla planifolia]|uniref:D-2-hydroxyglutarate dehydrogenase n=1 Tax=Vanilla planifolia TaxID=51239 RepID=A0A835UR05_VANPL|nr:hypothetical protein HPP92_017497 [Vanilla planifolia]
MVRPRASEFLLACRRIRQGLWHRHGHVLSSRYFSRFYGEHDPSKNCIRPSFLSGNVLYYHALDIAKIFSSQHRLFNSASMNTKRNPAFSSLRLDDICYFEDIVGNKNVVQDEDRLFSANVDWMRKYKGSSPILLLPNNTEQLSKILRYCNSRSLAVVPQGGNTGLVGGSVPVYDEVIINLSSMNKIVSFDKVNGILICEAGCILENLNTFLANEGFMMPIDLGAKGSCQIGGNVSTNAGGLHFIRYGSLHGNILGLEVVLADGTILDMLTTLRKDNTGYDLKHLFIGSEGTLGIITKVVVLTPWRLSSTNIAFLACNDYLSCQKLLAEARRGLGDAISAFEFMDYNSVIMALKYIEGARNPYLPHHINFMFLLKQPVVMNHMTGPNLKLSYFAQWRQASFLMEL